MKDVGRLLVTTLLGALCSFGCSSPSEPSTPSTVVLAPGETATYGALATRFIGVTADSRCPANALCILQGDASLTIEARVGRAGPTRYALQVNDPVRRRVVHAGYVIQVDDLSPYPFTIATINPIPSDEYRVTLTFDRD